MNTNTAPVTYESNQSSEAERRNIREIIRGQAESGAADTPHDLAALFQQLSDKPAQEVEKLINALQTLRKQLQNAGDRIQRDIAEYAHMSDQVMRLTAIIDEAVKNLPSGPRR